MTAIAATGLMSSALHATATAPQHGDQQQMQAAVTLTANR